MRHARTRRSLKKPKELNPDLDVEKPKELVPVPNGTYIGINYSQDRSKYDPGFHPNDFLCHCREGASKVEIAAFWGISLSTLSRWCQTYEDMQEAYEKGKAAQQAWILSKTKQAAFGGIKGVQSNLIMFMLVNMCGWGQNPQTDFDDVQDVDVDINAYPRQVQNG